MAVVKKSALVPYTCAEMYRLVNDVDAYHEFLPWCSGSKVVSDDGELMQASIELELAGFHKSFATRNLQHIDKMIEIRLDEGPFRRLDGFWRFDRLGDAGCKVALDLEYEFSNRLLSTALGKVFKEVANSLVDAFCSRAITIYGKR